MISLKDKNKDENSFQTKKSELLISRNATLQNADNFDDNIHNTALNADSSHSNLKPSIRKRKVVSDSQAKTNEMSANTLLEKSRFEEVEDKLEEMFAGIEDEQLTANTTPVGENMTRKFNEPLDKYIKSDYNDTNTDNKEILSQNSLKYDSATSTSSSIPAKSVQKSKIALTCNEDTNQLNLLLRDHKKPAIPKSLLYLKTMPQRRRLSIGINKELINLSLKDDEEINKIKNSNDNNIMPEDDLSQLPFNLKSNGDVKKIKKNIPKNKINKNNQKKCLNKKEITFINSNNSDNKIKNRKTEVPIKDTQSGRKMKKMRSHRLLSSDAEEKQLQTRDVETKTRSPFVLLKNNGGITVVNTVTPDDCNEKLTKSKKHHNYVFERKTVKGCYSSTLGNRYDADTPDSSWKCVFCKNGPHKKGLGDLFGPYIISSDCDEYRSAKDYLEKCQKFQRNDAPPLCNFSNKSVTFINETPNSYSQIKSKSSCEYSSFHTYGMSQVTVDSFEIWVHEDCAIWGPNIFVVGSRLAGLEEASWNSTLYECIYCLKQGALLCCLQRDCKTTSHVPCAREAKWLLDESKFWVYCNNHSFLNKN